MAKNERAKRKQQEQRSRKREKAKQQAKAQALPTARSALVELAAQGSFGVEPRIDPEPYLRDLFYLVREWPVERIVELAPAHWQATVAEEPARGMLERNVLRSATQ